jgi:hypothetical protein
MANQTAINDWVVVHWAKKQTNGAIHLLIQKVEVQVSEDYDVVIDVLQKHHDKLWDMSKNKDEWGIMDHIRLEQMDQLKKAMKMWREHNEQGLL